MKQELKSGSSAFEATNWLNKRRGSGLWKAVWWVAFTLLIAITPGYGDFSRFESFLENENLWQTTPDSFLANPQDQIFFRWLSSKNEAARYPGYSNSPKMTFLEKKCWEAVVKFDAGNLTEVAISLYNRGDAGDIDDKAKYLEMVQNISDDIEKWVGEKGVVLPEQWLANGKKLKKKVWVKHNNLAIEMRWSASEHIQAADPQRPGIIKPKFRAEYIQLVVMPFNPQNDPRKNRTFSAATATATIGKAASVKDIKDNVKKDADEYVYIANIPMVDQGQKGYCAVATAQRILEYYGVNIDEHEIAQMANTDAKKGTQSKDMFDMIKKLGVKFGVKVSSIIAYDNQKFIALVNDYNQVARSQKKKEITLENTWNVPAIYDAMEPDILKIARCAKNKTSQKKFFSDIMKHVDAGIPLAWGIVTGKVTENPPSPLTSGGHMRLIFGYNNGSSEVLYTDSWGAGHERKTMSLDDAWTITDGLYVIEPKRSNEGREERIKTNF